MIVIIVGGTISSIYKTFKNIELNFVTPMDLPKENITGYLIFDINENKNFDSDSLLASARKNPIILTGGEQITLETFAKESEEDTGDDKNKIINLAKKERKQLYVPIECISEIKYKNQRIYSRISNDTAKLNGRCKSSSNHCILTQENDNFNLSDLENNICQNIITLPSPLEFEPYLVKEYRISAFGDCVSNCEINVENQIYSFKSKFFSTELISRAFDLESINKETLSKIKQKKIKNSIPINSNNCIEKENIKCNMKKNDSIIEESPESKNKKIKKLTSEMKACSESNDFSCAIEKAKQLMVINPENKELKEFNLGKDNSISIKNSTENSDVKEKKIEKNSSENSESKVFNSETKKDQQIINENENFNKSSKNITEIKENITPIYSASFDCNKASMPSEKAICNSSKLSALDNELSNIYKQLKNSSLNKEHLKHEQIQFIKKIRACLDNEICIDENYSLRISELKKF